jgi:hypothetical protein
LEPSGLQIMLVYRWLVVGAREKHIPDQSVDLLGVNVVQLLQGTLDLGLVGLDVDDEDESVVLLNLLHGRLGVERVDNDLVLVQAGLVGDGLAVVLGSTRQLESLGAVEGGRQSDLAGLVGVALQRIISIQWSL